MTLIGCLQDELTTTSVKHGYNNALAIQDEVRHVQFNSFYFESCKNVLKTMYILYYFSLLLLNDVFKTHNFTMHIQCIMSVYVILSRTILSYFLTLP